MWRRNLVVMALGIALAGCSSVPGNVSQSAVAFAPMAIKEQMIRSYPNIASTNAQLELKGFQVVCASPMDLSPADKANGLTKRWCVLVKGAWRVPWTTFADVKAVVYVSAPQSDPGRLECNLGEIDGAPCACAAK